MSTFQSPDSRPQTPAKAPPKDNRSFTNLRMELGEDAELLKYLPFNRATFQPQYELQGAASERLLYGDMMDEKDQLWVYFTMLGGGKEHNKDGGNRMISFYTLKGASNGEGPFRQQNVQNVALASAPFKLARNAYQVMAIAKYFFVRRGVEEKLHVPISVRTFKDDLVRACHNYKSVHVKVTAARKISAAPTVARAVDGDNGQPPLHCSPTPARSLTPRHLDQDPEHLDSQDRDAKVDKYIALQAQEEELDRKINDAEDERFDIAAQIVGFQARLEEAEDNKAALMDEKDKIKAAKKSLQSSLDMEEQLEFGFEAGRRMESKRRKQN